MPLGVEALEAAVDAALAAEASRDCSPRESACQCDAEAAEARACRGRPDKRPLSFTCRTLRNCRAFACTDFYGGLALSMIG